MNFKGFIKEEKQGKTVWATDEDDAKHKLKALLEKHGREPVGFVRLDRGAGFFVVQNRDKAGKLFTSLICGSAEVRERLAIKREITDL